jgi:DNA mismatch repair protein MSH2
MVQFLAWSPKSDGFGLAYAIARYIVEEVKCATIFATHFHELTAMEEEFAPLVNNKHVSAEKPNGGELTFMYKVLDGPCLQSFGIDVAEMAGMVASVVEEAKRKAKELERFEYKGSDEQIIKRFKKIERVSMESGDEALLRAVRGALD